MMQRRTIHQLKTARPWFGDILSGIKTFEIRKDDRNFKIDDILYLREWTGAGYTGREAFYTIIYKMDAFLFHGIENGYCVLGIRKADL